MGNESFMQKLSAERRERQEWAALPATRKFVEGLRRYIEHEKIKVFECVDSSKHHDVIGALHRAVGYRGGVAALEKLANDLVHAAETKSNNEGDPHEV